MSDGSTRTRRDWRGSRVRRRWRRTSAPTATTRSAFAREVLGVTSATLRSDGSAYQDEILAAVAAEPRVAVLAGHGVGKTRALAVLALWWLLTRRFSRAALVAPQLTRQVRGVVFAEVRALVRRARVVLPVEALADRVRVAGHGASGARWTSAGTEPDRIEGQHAEGGLLLMMDETKGIPQEVFDALMGALTGGDDSRLVVASTPGGCAGPFYRAVTDAHGRWRVFRIPATDSSLVAPEWIADRRGGVGRRVAALPGAGARRVRRTRARASSSRSRCWRRRRTTARGRGAAGGRRGRGPLAGGGPQLRRGGERAGSSSDVATWRSPDLMATVARVVTEVLACGDVRRGSWWTRAGPAAAWWTGSGSSGTPRWRRSPSADGATDPTRFRNRRAEAFFTLRERLERGEAALLDDDDLLADLAATSYRFDQAGRVLLDPKDEVRRRLGRSPDRGDASRWRWDVAVVRCRRSGAGRSTSPAAACWCASGPGWDRSRRTHPLTRPRPQTGESR